jgi:hypothetical protein
VLDGRRTITVDDWTLAGVVKAASDNVPRSVIAAVDYDTARRDEAAQARHARREVAAADVATHRTRVGRRRPQDRRQSLEGTPPVDTPQAPAGRR